jgi:hypothetical protein
LLYYSTHPKEDENMRKDLKANPLCEERFVALLQPIYKKIKARRPPLKSISLPISMSSLLLEGLKTGFYVLLFFSSPFFLGEGRERRKKD